MAARAEAVKAEMGWSEAYVHHATEAKDATVIASDSVDEVAKRLNTVDRFNTIIDLVKSESGEAVADAVADEAVTVALLAAKAEVENAMALIRLIMV